MKSLLTAVILSISAIASVLSFSSVPTANAQYPFTVGSCTLLTSSLSVTIGGVIVVSATVRDGSGLPAPGQTVLFTVFSPGGAFFSPASAITDGAGVATTSLFLGAGGGPVSITATSGLVQCGASVLGFQPLVQYPTFISSIPVLPPPVPPVPPVQPIQQVAESLFIPPRTGDAGLLSHEGDSTLPWAALVGGTLSLLALSVVRKRLAER